MFGREQKFYHGFLETEASNDPGKGQQQLNWPTKKPSQFFVWGCVLDSISSRLSLHAAVTNMLQPGVFTHICTFWFGVTLVNTPGCTTFGTAAHKDSLELTESRTQSRTKNFYQFQNKYYNSFATVNAAQQPHH
jgi:hypothetical protein